MKTLLLTLLLLPVLALQPATAQRHAKAAAKAAAQEQAFMQLKSQIDSNRFSIDVDRVYPQSGRDVSRFNPRGKITIQDTIARGSLPFFGRAYSLPYGEEGGIEFDGPVKDRQIKTVQKRKEKFIRYAFSVNGKNDVYKFTIEIATNGNCQIHLISNNRTQISYSGLLESLE